MTTTSADDILANLLVTLHRSLLQYVKEAWPWTDAHNAANRDAVLKAAAEQEQTVDNLADLLQDRGYPVGFGSYPDFSYMNYVSLDYLLKRLVENQKRVVNTCQAAERTLEGVPEDAALAQAISAAEQDRLALLQSLAAKSGKTTAAV
jgi:hypothetical protein